MSERFEDKDYEEYFSQLERQLARQNTARQQPEPPAPRPKRRSYRAARRMALLRCAAVITAAAVVIGSGVFLSVRFFGRGSKSAAEDVDRTLSGIQAEQSDDQPEIAPFQITDATVTLGEEVESDSVIFINIDTNEVVARKNADVQAFPASTTKIMTALVASELITDFNDTFTMTVDITDPLYIAGATVAGFSIGEEISMTDLLYGTILPSGGDAAIGLAQKLAGSEEAFTRLMNERAKQLGLTGTHFTNVTGLYDENHYTTATEMAMILRAAMESPLCRKILSTYRYTTAKTPQHPDGIALTSTLFSYMYGSEPEGAQIDGGKTGYVDESGYCIATFGHGDSGTQYLCVTFKAPSRWPAVYDQINLFTEYAQ